MQRPTIRSVAERAGVSKSLVSLVLQDSPKVSPGRRARVLAAVQELGYQPHPQARGLAERRTRTIGVLVDDLRNPWCVDVLDGLRPLLAEHGLRPVLEDTRSDPDAARTFARLRVDGLVVVGTLPDVTAVREVAETLPTVLAGTRDDVGPRVDVVAGDDDAGVRLVVEHLLALGHRRIGHVCGPGPVGRIRREAFEAAGRAAGVTTVVEVGGTTEDAGYRAGLALLSRPDRPSAVLAVNDLAAVGVLAAADERGLSVPGDVSVAGYDDTSLARLRAVSLTSVDNAAHRIGTLAAERLLARVAEPDAPGGLLLVPPRLVVRGSTAAPRRGWASAPGPGPRLAG